MGKISKKYIGDDQVGHIQLELENAGSLRAKSQDGLSSVDLLEYSADDLLVVQQDLYMLADKDIISQTALGSNFNIQTANGASIVLEPTATTGSDNGGEVYIKGGDSASGIAGAIFLWPGQDSSNLKSSVQVDAGALVLQSSCPIQMFGGVGQNLQIYESFDYASSYGIKSNNYNLVMYTNNQTAAATDSFKVSLITGNSDLANSGAIEILTGSAEVDAGDILIQTGLADTGSAGDISLISQANTAGNKGLIKAEGYEFQLRADTRFMQFSADSNKFFQTFFTGSDFSSVVRYVPAANSISIGGGNSADSENGAPVYFKSTNVFSMTGGTFTGGAVFLESVASDAGNVIGNAEVSSGDVTIRTGDAVLYGTGANASSGDILIETGAEAGTGTRGSITLDALEVQCSAMLIRDVADPVLAQDAATKAYVDQQIAAGTTCNKEIITLSAGDISNQYVDLEEQMIPESLVIGVGQRVNLYETLDYTVSIVGGVTRLTFAGPSATGGAEALVADDVLYITGIVDISP
jgi:hypothetical protein